MLLIILTAWTARSFISSGFTWCLPFTLIRPLVWSFAANWRVPRCLAFLLHSGPNIILSHSFAPTLSSTPSSSDVRPSNPRGIQLSDPCVALYAVFQLGRQFSKYACNKGILMPARTFGFIAQYQ
ncbi:unnamed protein product [Protopolystoma xenopodis]|uniref:Uncharacterized protein n=1 Tax=Protopolystoma xenopodis TaxID=117903 RepID=A0A448WQM4_9PLAT|nr:unnamed protein product [Protopolystoma xenopodis]